MHVASVQTAWPVATPSAVKTPASRPPASVFRIVNAVSGPGTAITSRETPRKATSWLVTHSILCHAGSSGKEFVFVPARSVRHSRVFPRQHRARADADNLAPACGRLRSRRSASPCHRRALRAGRGGRPARPEPSRAPAGTLAAEKAPARTLLVHVVGAVRKPGLYRLRDREPHCAMRSSQAGGAKPKAALELVNLASPVADGQQVVVPARGDPGQATAAAGGAAGSAGGQARRSI